MTNEPASPVDDTPGAPGAGRPGPAVGRAAPHPSLASQLKPLASPGGALVAIGIYEGFATKVNEAVAEPVLPSLTTAINRFTWRAVGRKLYPTWAPTVTYLAAGAVIGAIQARRAVAKAKAKPSR